jgi:hypothetical protein
MDERERAVIVNIKVLNAAIFADAIESAKPTAPKRLAAVVISLFPRKERSCG